MLPASKNLMGKGKEISSMSVQVLPTTTQLPYIKQFKRKVPPWSNCRVFPQAGSSEIQFDSYCPVHFRQKTTTFQVGNSSASKQSRAKCVLKIIYKNPCGI